MSDAAYRIWNEVWPGVPQEKMREALTRLSPGDRVGPGGEYVVVPVGAARSITYYAMLAALKEQDK